MTVLSAVILTCAVSLLACGLVVVSVTAAVLYMRWQQERDTRKRVAARYSRKKKKLARARATRKQLETTLEFQAGAFEELEAQLTAERQSWPTKVQEAVKKALARAQGEYQAALDKARAGFAGGP